MVSYQVLTLDVANIFFCTNMCQLCGITVWHPFLYRTGNKYLGCVPSSFCTLRKYLRFERQQFAHLLCPKCNSIQTSCTDSVLLHLVSTLTSIHFLLLVGQHISVCQKHKGLESYIFFTIIKFYIFNTMFRSLYAIGFPLAQGFLNFYSTCIKNILF